VRSASLLPSFRLLAWLAFSSSKRARTAQNRLFVIVGLDPTIYFVLARAATSCQRGRKLAYLVARFGLLTIFRFVAKSRFSSLKI